ncbi:hypothetical protein DH09_18150 [Bacillaceae bacterium JMAK1]|nr:hypothetical protein DH09_18150 [Bacillaceae bacterium JMAK1]
MKIRTISLLFILLFIAGCDQDQSTDSARPMSNTNEMTDEAIDVEEEALDMEVEETDQTESSVETSERMVVQNGHLEVVVEAFDDMMYEIESTVMNLDGYVVETSVQGSEEGERSGSLLVRIPEDDFQSFMDEVVSTSTELVHRSTYGNDVTEEYIDLESRLRSQEVVEERLVTFLEAAENTEDLLTISDDLANVQQEIETIEGRMNYLDNQVDFATINLYIYEQSSTALQDQSTLNTWQNATNLFTGTINALLSVVSFIVVTVVGLSPVLVPASIGIIVWFWLYKRKRE